MERRNQALTSDVMSTKSLEWHDLGLGRATILGAVAQGFDRPSPVQEEVIPLVLRGKSVIARAKNGTGKTAAYLVPLLDRVEVQRPEVQALVLVPTRELAMQTSHVITGLARSTGLQHMVATGGTLVREDVLRLQKGVHVVIGTPGRAIDLALRNLLDLRGSRFLVLDEADKLLSDDFQPIIVRLLELFGAPPQVLLFSATYPKSVQGFLARVPGIVQVNLMTELTLKGVTQYYAYLEEREKVACLRVLFSKLQIDQVIIFCNSALRVELLAQKIVQMNFSCFFIHAKMDQNARNKVFHNFRKGQGRCLVTSDLFTRGIDVPNINVVVNFDFPSTAETYLHRVGRSGRFGHFGLAINFMTDRDKDNLIRIEEELRADIQPIPEHIEASLY